MHFAIIEVKVMRRIRHSGSSVIITMNFRKLINPTGNEEERRIVVVIFARGDRTK